MSQSATSSEALAHAPLFRDLDDAAKQRLLSGAVTRTLKPRTRLWKAGDRPDAIAVVLVGSLAVVEPRRGTRLRLLGLGSVVGLSTLAGAAHSADVLSAETTRVLLIPGDRVRAEAARDPRPLLGALAQLSDWIADLSQQLEELRTEPLATRLARALERDARGLREVRATHAELAAQIGASRERTSKALESLEQRGLIRLGRGRVELLRRL